jgi:RES domain
MNLKDLEYVPTATLPALQTVYRVQRTAALSTTVTVGPLLLPPAGLLSGRFDLATMDVGYFAETPETAAFEALARREAKTLSLAVLGQRGLICVQATLALQLLDLRPHTPTWPVLQSQRMHVTQTLAAAALQAGFEGIVYRSAQQYGHDCYAVFGAALHGFNSVWSQPVLKPSGAIHPAVMAAIQGAQIPLVP